jgi:hypothetical protein
VKRKMGKQEATSMAVATRKKLLGGETLDMDCERGAMGLLFGHSGCDGERECKDEQHPRIQPHEEVEMPPFIVVEGAVLFPVAHHWNRRDN